MKAMSRMLIAMVMAVAGLFVSTGTGTGPADLGNDARSVAQVKVAYTWQGATHALSDP